MIIWHNGTYKQEHDFHFHLSDRVRYGDGVFDTMLAVDGISVWSDLHLQRLFNSAEILRIPVAYDEDDFTSAIRDVLNLNNFSKAQAVINIIISRGSAPRGLMPPSAVDPEIIVMAGAAPKDYPPVHAIISQTTRRNEFSPLSRIKSFNYGDSILALMEAKEKDANEALLLNSKNYLAGASAGNVYILQNGTLWTPTLSDGATDGIVRKQLIAQGHVQEKSLQPRDLYDAEGVYISNSIRGLFPIEQLDGRSLPLANLPFAPHFHTKLNF